MSLVQLLEGDRVVEPSQTNVATIYNLGPLVERALAGVDGYLLRKHALAADPYSAGAKACSWPSGGRSIKGRTEDGDVILVPQGLRVRQGIDVRQVGEGLQPVELGSCHDVDLIVLGGQGAEGVLVLLQVLQITVRELPRPRRCCERGPGR